MYVFGGWNRKIHFADAYRYNFETFTWQRMDIIFSCKGVSQHSLAVHDDNLYIFGGFVDGASSNAVYVYKLTE